MPSPTLTKYKDELPIPKAAVPAHRHADGTPHYVMVASQFAQCLHSDLPAPTQVWGFNGTYPGPILDAEAGRPIVVDWRCALPMEHVIKPVITGKPPLPPLDVRMITHFHGGHTPPESDGHPLDAFGPSHTRRDRYPLRQDAATYWYHDHAMGLTRFNAYAGLSGLFIVRDPGEAALGLPDGAFDLPLVFQDRSFAADGSLTFVTRPDAPEYFGDVAMVNGKAWPRLDVEPRAYRFRLLNGSNARFYDLSLSDGRTFHVIAGDGGLLAAPWPTPSLLIAPGERYEIVVDFSGAAGSVLTLKNAAPAPHPGGDAATPQIDEVMQFRVAAGPVAAPWSPPATLRDLPPAVVPTNARSRDFVLSEVTMDDGMKTVLINGKGFLDPITEAPVLGTTEVWNFYNTTGDSHPMHLHLIQFRVVGRGDFDAPDASIPLFRPKAGAALTPPGPAEAGWKDTVVAPPGTPGTPGTPGKLTQIVVHFDGYAGRYVWHCHILEHEEGDMMRPMIVLPPHLGNGGGMGMGMGM